MTRRRSREPVWVRCLNCEEYWCRRHERYVSDCACPPIEDWAVSPYGAATPGAAVSDANWKALERQAAALFGGRRHWANSGQRLDFEGPTAIGQCKLVQRLSLEELSTLAEEMEREGQAVDKFGVVVVKVRRGAGRKSPLLVVCTAAMWQRMNGRAAPGPDEELPE